MADRLGHQAHQASGRKRVAEGLVVPMKPGNSGGGKGPWFQDADEAAGKEAIDDESSNAEKIQTLQRKLYLKAKREPTFRFYALYDKVCRPDILAHAYALAKANGGAPGVDGVRFEDIEAYGRERFLAELRR